MPETTATTSAPPTETTSLLPAHPVSESTGHEILASGKRTPRYVLAIVCISVIASDFGNSLSLAPHIAIYESLICKHLFGDQVTNTGHGNACKSDLVQEELALLTSWKGTFDQLPGIGLAMFYGLAADRIGRKPVLLMALSGLMLEETCIRLISFSRWIYSDLIPLRAIWLTPIFQLIGGGPGIASSMAYSIITDTFPASQRASIYFLLAAAILVGEIVATPLSASLMSWTPWLPSLAGIGCQFIGLLAAAIVPETMPHRSLDDESAKTRGSCDAQPQCRTSIELKSSSWMAWCRHYLHKVPSRNMVCIIGAFLTASMGTASIGLLIQYASKRFSWSIARASLLLSLKGSINLICLLVVLPYVSRKLAGRLSPGIKDLRIVQGSALCWAIGFGSIAFAASSGPFIAGIAVLALGSGLFSALRSLANSLGTPSQIGFINTSIGLSISIGSVMAGPALAAAFKRGMGLGGIWSGLPYVISACLLLFATCLSWGISAELTEANPEQCETAGDDVGADETYSNDI